MSKLSVTIEEYTYEIELSLVAQSGAEVTVLVDGTPVTVVLPGLAVSVDEMEWMIIDGRPYEVNVDPDFRWIRTAAGMYPLEIHDRESVMQRPATGDGRIKAPIPGQITCLMVAVGEAVEVGQPLMILEAMKMENEIRSPRAGVVKRLNVTPGQGVTLYQVLAEIV